MFYDLNLAFVIRDFSFNLKYLNEKGTSFMIIVKTDLVLNTGLSLFRYLNFHLNLTPLLLCVLLNDLFLRPFLFTSLNY